MKTLISGLKSIPWRVKLATLILAGTYVDLYLTSPDLALGLLWGAAVILSMIAIMGYLIAR